MPDSPSTPMVDVEAALDDLVRLHYASLRRLAESILNDADEAEDVVQETFIAASRAWGSYRGAASLRTWLTTITINRCRDGLRRRRARQALHNTLQSLHLLQAAPVSPEDNAQSSERDRLLWRAVDQLDEKHRLTVILRYVHELSVPEIARVLDVREGTIHSRLHHARQRIQQTLRADPGANLFPSESETKGDER